MSKAPSLDADLLLVMPAGRYRNTLRAELAERVRSIRVATDARRLSSHLRRGPASVALVDLECLDEATRRAIERDRRGVALAAFDEDLPRMEAAGSLDGPVLNRLIGSLGRRLATAQEAWAEEEILESIKGFFLADTRTGEVVVADGLGRDLMGDREMPGPGRRELSGLVSELVEDLPMAGRRIGELIVERNGGRQRVVWGAQVQEERKLRPRVLRVSLCDETLALNWLEHRAEEQWLDSVAATAEQMSHDFNNILQAILSHLDLLRLELAEHGLDHDTLCAPMEEAATAGVKLTSRILSLTRGGGGRRERVALDAILGDVVRRAGVELGREPRVTLQASRRVLQLRADRIRLVDALAGLVRVGEVDELEVLETMDQRLIPIRQDGGLKEAGSYVAVRLHGQVPAPAGETGHRVTGSRARGFSGDCVLAMAIAQRALSGQGGVLVIDPSDDRECGATVYLPLCEEPPGGGGGGRPGD